MGDSLSDATQAWRSGFPEDPDSGQPSRERRALVGRSAGIVALRELISKVAASEAAVLIEGETGTGKEIVARNIHAHSRRRHGPFVAVNCGAIPAELLESELFGHEKGAFTGALSNRKGRFELAAGGTLFLDEIGDMRLDMQVKLLRVLQERQFERLGANVAMAANVRIVAATHQDLEGLIAQGRFREDLYYRLNVFPLATPPLRERPEDLPLLIDELLNRLRTAGAPVTEFGTDAVCALAAYHWPGNVRELANLVERCSILKPGGVVGPFDLPPRMRAAAPRSASTAAERPDAECPMAAVASSMELPKPLNLKALLSDLERRLIRQALDECGGIVAQAAKQLGLRRTTLVEKMRKLNVDRLPPGSASADFLTLGQESASENSGI